MNKDHVIVLLITIVINLFCSTVATEQGSGIKEVSLWLDRRRIVSQLTNIIFSRCICGETRQARIVCPYGENCTAGIGTLPWQAGLVFRGSWQPWCGASLISDSYLVSIQLVITYYEMLPMPKLRQKIEPIEPCELGICLSSIVRKEGRSINFWKEFSLTFVGQWLKHSKRAQALS